MLWAADVCSRAACAQPGPVSSISLGQFLADRTIGRAFVTACRLSVCLSVCRLWRFVSRQNGWTDLHEIFREGSGKVWSDHGTTTLHFVNSGKPRDAAILISLSSTLRENGWTDLHECTTAFAQSTAIGQYGRPS